ncbi:SDR family oxidoreductase [Parvularcula sp. ZS-1/3]|uniref:SDR family oxidoreductase n=1 Tax=Parvularcula mediterranea TaxID=2732508 RepID=A0A7Y3RMD9_9PROT|nr:SDR family oxidoreductase [Parvularcula mediterranea]NNU15927.1 SDR family oxidoreductase [Parvularcula mediterranea]
MTGTALITGASSGIGLELARIHARRKGNLVIVARSVGKLEELKSELESQHGISVLVIAEDLSSVGAAKRIHDRVQAEGIEIEVLINNAGFGGQGAFIERDWEADRDMIEVNVIALSELCRFFIPHMVARNKGRVLNVSSTAALIPGPLQATYFATKAFVTSLSNALHEELRKTKVTVTALMPGATETGFASEAGLEGTELFKETASAASVAKAGYSAMMAGKLNVIAGVPFARRITYALLPFIPKSRVLRVVRKTQETG